MTKKETGRGPTHDSSYKLLYSHTAMVEDLLRGFIPETWIVELDLTSLKKCSGSKYPSPISVRDFLGFTF